MKIIKEKSFYKNIMTIVVPIAMQNLITVAISMLDTIMLGRADSVGTLLSASSLANQPFFLLNIITFGLAGGATVLMSQYWGKGDILSIKKILSMIIKIAFLISLFSGLVVLLFPEGVLKLFSGNEQIIKSGAEYLRIIGYAYFVFGITNATICSIRSVEIVKISVVINLVSLFVNGFLNWVLIFGNFGFPALGIKGAAIATLLARAIEFIIISVYILKIDKRMSFKLKDLLLFDNLLFKDLLTHGLPVLTVELLWSLGMTIQAAIFGHITYSDADPVAANSIMGVVQQLSTIAIFGVANAAAVFVGKSIGENDIKAAVLRAHTFKYISFVVGFLATVFILIARDVAVSFYTVPIETKELARELLNVMAIQTFFVSISSVTLIGTLRGAGDTKFCLKIDVLTLWGFSIPLAFVAAFVFKLPVPLVLFIMKSDEALKALGCTLRMNGTKWLNSVTREFV